MIYCENSKKVSAFDELFFTEQFYKLVLSFPISLTKCVVKMSYGIKILKRDLI